MPDMIYDEERGLYAVANGGESELDTVFMIGDSIRMGYFPYVRQKLEGKLRLIAPEENCRYTQYTYTCLAEWKNLCPDPDKVRLVYWNNGHWDIAHWDGAAESLNSVSQYARMLVRIHHRLRRYFPKAKVIFAATTPNNPDGSVGINPRTNAEVETYNQAARETLAPLGVQFDDLYSLLAACPPEAYADYCHLKPEKFRELGDHVASIILANIF